MTSTNNRVCLKRLQCTAGEIKEAEVGIDSRLYYCIPEDVTCHNYFVYEMRKLLDALLRATKFFNEVNQKLFEELLCLDATQYETDQYTEFWAVIQDITDRDDEDACETFCEKINELTNEVLQRFKSMALSAECKRRYINGVVIER